MDKIGIFAVDDDWGFGLNNGLPWHYKRDMAIFKNVTTTSIDGKKNTIIMGYNTHKSIGTVLPDRYNIVVDKNYNVLDYAPRTINECTFVRSTDCISFIVEDNNRASDTIFYIGGVKLFERVWDSLTGLIVTYIHTKHKCDTYFPKNLQESIGRDFVKKSSQDYVENKVHLELVEYDRA